eukprot:scaffold307424_cov26-Prasinocladus_malaysianus.AAC.1
MPWLNYFVFNTDHLAALEAAVLNELTPHRIPLDTGSPSELISLGEGRRNLRKAFDFLDSASRKESMEYIAAGATANFDVPSVDPCQPEEPQTPPPNDEFEAPSLSSEESEDTPTTTLIADPELPTLISEEPEDPPTPSVSHEDAGSSSGEGSAENS